MALQAKLPSHCVFQRHIEWLQNFRNCFKPEMQNHKLKTFNLVINLSLISNKASNLYFVICSEINTVSTTNIVLL